MVVFKHNDGEIFKNTRKFVVFAMMSFYFDFVKDIVVTDIP